MDRRTLLAGMGAVLLAAPLAALAQQTKVYRVGWLFQGSPDSPGSSVTKRRRILVEALRELGYIEGQNLIIERRYAESRMERFPSLVAELVALKPDVIIVESTPGAWPGPARGHLRDLA